MPPKLCSNRCDIYKWWLDGWEINQSNVTVPEIKMTIKAEDLTGLDVKAEMQPYKYANTVPEIQMTGRAITQLVGTVPEIQMTIKEKEKNMKHNEQMRRTVFVPPVVDMKSFNNKVVVVYFADGTHTRAVCSDNDIFDLDTGIMCCLFKRALDRNNGTKVLNKLIRSVHDVAESKEAVRKAALNLKKARREAQAAAHARNVEAEAKANAEMVDIVAAGVKKALEEAKAGET